MASDCVYWSGTAPSCSGRCPDYCTVLRSSPDGDGTGATCVTGIKLLCDCCASTTTLTTTSATTSTTATTTTATTTTIPSTTVTFSATTVIGTTIVSTSSSVVTPSIITTRSNVGPIAGGLFGGLVAFALIILVGFYCIRKKRRLDELEEQVRPRPPSYLSNGSK